MYSLRSPSMGSWSPGAEGAETAPLLLISLYCTSRIDRNVKCRCAPCSQQSSSFRHCCSAGWWWSANFFGDLETRKARPVSAREIDRQGSLSGAGLGRALVAATIEVAFPCLSPAVVENSPLFRPPWPTERFSFVFGTSSESTGDQRKMFNTRQIPAWPRSEPVRRCSGTTRRVVNSYAKACPTHRFSSQDLDLARLAMCQCIPNSFLNPICKWSKFCLSVASKRGRPLTAEVETAHAELHKAEATVRQTFLKRQRFQSIFHSS